VQESEENGNNRQEGSDNLPLGELTITSVPDVPEHERHSHAVCKRGNTGYLTRFCSYVVLRRP
jgi:hypothetical protein